MPCSMVALFFMAVAPMITAVVMVGEAGGESVPVAWVQGARRAAARDLIAQLARQPQVARIVLVSADADGLLSPAVTDYRPTPPGRVHVGEILARLSTELAIDRLLYFGGGAAPLLPDVTLSEIVQRLAAADQLILTNNRFASDWAGIVPAGILPAWISKLPRDNMLGWVLSEEAGLPHHTLPTTAATRLDIDTPTDLLALALHPRTQPHLRAYLASLPLQTATLQAALAVLGTSASRVFVAGRLGPEVWQAINQVSHCWLRVVSEERGMVSSGRQQRGEVRSLLAAHIAAVGLDAFFATLADWADAAFIDTRVMLAHQQIMPDATTRFGSDLGLLELVADPWLRAFTAAAQAAPIPIVLGGHGLLAGDMLACCEILATRPGWPGDPALPTSQQMIK